MHVDPRSLLVHPGNLRTDLGDLTELEASIAANGVVQALTLIPDADGYRILAGHRRAAAAVAVLDSGRWPENLPATVPGVVRADLADAAASQVAVMLVENDADQRTPLTVCEQAAGYAQLAAFDLDAAEIGRRLGKTVAHVEAVMRLGRMTATVRAHADAGRLSLEDVAELAEFDDDPKAMDRILKDAGSPWGIRHRIVDERRRRSDAKAEQSLRAELADAGVAVVAKPKGWPYQCAAAAATSLIDPATGVRLDPDAVRTDERFATFIDTACSPPAAVVICRDPDAAGFKRTAYSSYESPEKLAAKEAARVAAKVRLQALTDAARTRHRFLAETYGSAKAAKVLFVDALRAVVEDPDVVDRGSTHLVTALAGGNVTATAGAKLDRLSRLLVARWVAGLEDNLAMTAESGRGWRRDPVTALAWLDRLVAAGYELAEAEVQFRDELAAMVAADAEEETVDVADVG
ncbi:ParB/RepB/Spo0J family partition protein [Virgisporangium ochraceum]|uniref:ParB/RepB/Spo0J family partition protein n=1 Tax=Virgisporangium ochraceum TaxID=65505 RepID=UPI0019447B05|nr:ParB N-terminal domain-containing protein [Virgisporangium ochraceum]